MAPISILVLSEVRLSILISTEHFYQTSLIYIVTELKIPIKRNRNFIDIRGTVITKILVGVYKCNPKISQKNYRLLKAEHKDRVLIVVIGANVGNHVISTGSGQMTYVMATVPKKYVPEGRTWLNYFRSQDCHKWIIALEHGSHGLVHWQLRWKQRGLDTKQQRESYFLVFKQKFPEAHLEFSDQWCDYERKEGNFVCSDDTEEILRIRFGTLRPIQHEILSIVGSQNDREIDCFLDKRGNHGKTWLSIHLWEQGRALLVPRYCGSAREISNFICSAYNGQRYIIIDIPRASKIKPELYEAIEEIKDGVVSDPRYSGKTRNVRGAKLIIFTNNPLDTKKLSQDRWRLHGISGESLT